MFVNWDEVQKALSPIKDFDDLSHRMRRSFSFPFVRNHFNFTLAELANYMDKMLGGDTRQRYGGYILQLKQSLRKLSAVGVPDVLSLMGCVASPDQFEAFHSQHRLNPLDTISVLKFLVYWCIPGEKHLSGLLQNDPEASAAIKKLQAAGVRSNLELLQAGITPQGRMALARKSNLPVEMITRLVNLSDFSRLPWASKATIANFFGAGYPSLKQLAEAVPDKLYADFFAYGKSIGKNLKLGNEIDNSYRIAKIVPQVLETGTP